MEFVKFFVIETFSNDSVTTNMDGCDNKYQIKYIRNIIGFSLEQI